MTTNTNPANRLTYTTSEASALLGVSRATLYRLVKRGLVHTTGRGLRTHLIEATELRRYLNDNGEDVDRAERSE